jgi:Carboxypeptidase regulatory-like domain
VSLFLRTTLLGALLALAVTAAVSAQSAGSIRGHVRDGSDAVIPGVTVEMAVSARVVGVTVTGAAGEFTFDAVPTGPVTLRLTLDGFQPETLTVDVHAGSQTVVSGVLRVGSLSERVLVLAPAPKRPPAPPPEPEYRVQPVPLTDLESVCGPAKADDRVWHHGTLGSHRKDAKRILFRLDDEITLNAHVGAEFVAGQNLVVRRYFRPREGRTTGEQTVGVVQVVRTSSFETLAVVIHACGELRAGDLLMPFSPEPVRTFEPAGVPLYRDAARILFGGNNEMMGAPGRLMVIDRGRLHGIRLGQRMTLFRSGLGGRTVVGDAVVLALREGSARIRVDHALGAVWLGDSAAPHRPRQ